MKNSIIIQNKELLGIDNLEVDFADVPYKSVVELAKKRIWVQGSKNIVEQSLYWIMYNVRSSKEALEG